MSVTAGRFRVHARRRRSDRAAAAGERGACEACGRSRRGAGQRRNHSDDPGGSAARVADPSQLSGLSAFKPRHAIGGIGGAAVVAVSLVAVRALGIAGVISLLVAGQLFISVLADRLGWFGVTEVGLTLRRLGGIALVLAGTLLITRP